MPDLKNIFENLPENNQDEIFEILESGKNFKIERIISNGQSSPAGFWYDQPQNEWVILLKGTASILFEGEILEKELTPGDYLLIPARKKHRVERTSNEETTIWLAVHFE